MYLSSRFSNIYQAYGKARVRLCVKPLVFEIITKHTARPELGYVLNLLFIKKNYRAYSTTRVRLCVKPLVYKKINYRAYNTTRVRLRV